jgi:aminotransferase in exopolysaccharide biosynthesis
LKTQARTASEYDLDVLIGKVQGLLEEVYGEKPFYPLHEPCLGAAEKKAMIAAIDSTYVSSVGPDILSFEDQIAKYTGAEAAVAVVNGTAGLHAALLNVGVVRDDLVITQPLTFVATCNAISYCSAQPLFVDVDRETLSLSPESLKDYLDSYTYLDANNICRLLKDDRVIRACIVVHSFGHSARIEEICDVLGSRNIKLVEDAAESLGSFYKGRHTGTFGDCGVVSFNGNKIITAGAGGIILTSHERAIQLKHLTTTAKSPHPYEFYHDLIGFNYRMPNINAALGIAQFGRLPAFLEFKRSLAEKYRLLMNEARLDFLWEPAGSRSNFWLSSVLLKSKEDRDYFLMKTNSLGIMTRPCWALMNDLPMYGRSVSGNLSNARSLSERLVNLPSSAALNV